jgi:SAM-dependent methyltransferase
VSGASLPGMKGRSLGKRYLTAFIDLGGLQPDHAVLEPGCGSGRMAEPLAEYLGDAGRYDGFDVVAEAVEWCQANIADKHPNFRFRHVDVLNKAYNPNGHLDPESFQFPYPDKAFDFVFLTSVFTHMLPPEVRHYLSEIRRVLRPRGTCLMTLFLMNGDSWEAIQTGRAERRFEHEGDGYLFDSIEVPERAIAYRDDEALSLLDQAGFSLRVPIQRGRWAGGPGSYGQDVVVVEPRGETAASDPRLTSD